MTPDIQTTTRERASLISWGAIFAGTLVALLTYMILMSLGVAIGGSQLQDIFRGQDDFSGWGWGTGIYLILATLISLFVGGYSASRVSGIVLPRVGRIQGAVVTALFFAFLFTQVGAIIGSVGGGVRSVVSSAGGAAVDLSRYPEVRNTIDRAIGDLNLKSPPESVAQGIAVRLLRGDEDGAKDFLASQSEITRAEADQRLENIRQDVGNALTDIGTKSAGAASAAGWSLFIAMLLGATAGVIGGAAGARARHRESTEVVVEHKTAA